MRFLFKLLTPIIVLLFIALSLLLLEERRVFDIRTLAQIDPIPKTEQLIKEKKYADAHEYLSYFMEYSYVNQNPKAVTLLADIDKIRASYSYRKDKFFEGVTKGKSDEDIGKVSAIISDFLIIGDIRDLTIAGTNYANGKEVDKTIVALSSLGILASASTLYSLGATAPVKSSISVLKFGKRAGKIPPWLNKQIIRQAKISTDTKSISNIQKLLEPIHNLYEKMGLNQTLNLVKRTKNFDELKGMVKLSSRFGKKSNILLQNGGAKSLKLIKEMPNVKNANLLYASTYGSRGITAIKKMGQSKFMSRMKFTANLAKTGYKGNFNSLFTKLLNTIPTKVLFGIAFLGLFYFLYKFSFLVRRVYSSS
ncbi:hypothetical protein GSY74_01270 [Sulfurovum sp. bin170]|uniref:hypothetical protein n=1 Tax=Sulfurovum sp. bin170 TaxID=2695268 RepID=UPI0013DF3DB1|nr:hypothetical protein [Sulfurovum sp. bin170]NEW59899.1 hypothetical protein [Sulfurovum sp. bin170]